MKVVFVKTKQTYIRITYVPDKNIIISLCECSIEQLNVIIDDLKLYCQEFDDLYFDDSYPESFIEYVKRQLAVREKEKSANYFAIDDNHKYYLVEPNSNLHELINSIEKKLSQPPTNEYILHKIKYYCTKNNIIPKKENIKEICHACGITLTQNIYQILSKEILLE